jgi:hypothetical protein
MVGPGAMGAAGLERLSRREQLRVLQLDEMQLSDTELRVPGQHVRWFGAARVDTPDDLRLELSPLRLVSVHALLAAWPAGQTSYCFPEWAVVDFPAWVPPTLEYVCGGSSQVWTVVLCWWWSSGWSMRGRLDARLAMCLRLVVTHAGNWVSSSSSSPSSPSSQSSQSMNRRSSVRCGEGLQRLVVSNAEAEVLRASSGATAILDCAQGWLQTPPWLQRY